MMAAYCRGISAVMAAAVLAQKIGELPRQVNFVSGPSRTADIEMTLVYGAHGPFRVHVLLLEE